jgi:hypothetical protein
MRIRVPPGTPERGSARRRTGGGSPCDAFAKISISRGQSMGLPVGAQCGHGVSVIPLGVMEPRPARGRASAQTGRGRPGRPAIWSPKATCGQLGVERTHRHCGRVLSHRMGPADPPSSHWEIQNLIFSYAELVDTGNFAEVGSLLGDATYIGGAGSVSGADAITRMLLDNVILYDDGTPRTKHITTNLAIEVDDAAGKASARSYFTALQAFSDFALQPIVTGRYHDRFERRDGQWRFVERRVQTDLVGDMSRHLRDHSTSR